MQMRGSAVQNMGLMISVLLVALNLRPSMAAVGPLLVAIRLDVPLGFGTASLLTMLPVMAMGLAMFFGMGIARYLGSYRSIMLSLALIGLATLARLFLDSAAELIFSAVLAGLGIALIQALMPALIKSRFKADVSLYMGLYVTAIMGGAALAASFSPLVMSSSGSWRVGLAVWSLLALLAMCFWFAQRHVLQSDASIAAGHRQTFFHMPRAWMLGIFFGLGTASYTCVLAWLAPYYLENGWGEQGAGLLLGFLTLMEVVSGLLVPALANRSRDKRVALVVLLILMMTGFAGLILMPQQLGLLWACLLGLGIGGLFPMSLIVSMDHCDDPQQAGSLTAFVQGVGYLIASLSPLLAGVIRDLTGSFAGAWWSLMALVVIMLLMVVRLDPRRYADHLRDALGGPVITGRQAE
ncbi:cyanate transporter [Pseudomonas syringae]|uniref:cyanate transporter n=1 Tax=Pseudomonas TaxID=286 RepID=UPI000516076E|nr:cyanate transporter [Pseudomonas syringae]KWS21575.1 MFS transporter [Pseudomonas syringae pv. syringae]KWS22403.1 MFS transporter [Pseudomonas syringae pv. syringae]MCF5028383.1 MFS transporter [Pseudomonas syringae]MCH5515240.1 cyanate transporter [Pseudomonas syringae pv. syringae]MCH5628453.1 cyanate transporter [Pseudomonas syringae pv. syringae]